MLPAHTTCTASRCVRRTLLQTRTARPHPPHDACQARDQYYKTSLTKPTAIQLKVRSWWAIEVCQYALVKYLKSRTKNLTNAVSCGQRSFWVFNSRRRSTSGCLFRPTWSCRRTSWRSRPCRRRWKDPCREQRGGSHSLRSDSAGWTRTRSWTSLERWFISSHF